MKRLSLIALLFSLFALSSLLYAQTVTVTSPNGGDAWQMATTQSIKWTSTGAMPSVKIKYSLDAGATWITITSSTANDGSYGWTVANAPSIQCLIRVSDSADGNPEDVSDATFSIYSTAPPPVKDSLTVLSPNGGEKFESGAPYNITFVKQGAISSVRIELSTDNGASWQFVGISPNNNFIWTVPAFISPVCLLRIADAADGMPIDLSDRVFSIVQPIKRGKLIVTWNPNVETDLLGYWVHYGEKPRSEAPYASAFFTTDTTYTIDNLLPGTYYVAITAIDNAGNESGFSVEVTGIIEAEQADVTPPQAPTGVNVKIE